MVMMNNTQKLKKNRKAFIEMRFVGKWSRLHLSRLKRGYLFKILKRTLETSVLQFNPLRIDDLLKNGKHAFL